MTKAVRRLLDAGDLPPVRVLETSDLHRAVPTAHHRMVNVAGGDDKLERLGELMSERQLLRAQAGGREPEKMMVFCNTMASCRAAEHYISEQVGVVLNIHGIKFEFRQR